MVAVKASKTRVRIITKARESSGQQVVSKEAKNLKGNTSIVANRDTSQLIVDPLKEYHEENMINDITKEVDDLSLVVVISEVNMICSNTKEWWFDTGVTRHVYSN